MTDIDETRTSILHRELTSLSDEVRAVGAPPMPILPEPYSLRPVEPAADADTVSEWMNLPHLIEGWESPWPPERWQRYMQAQVDGEYSRPCIISFKDAEVAYLEVYRAAKDSIAPRYAADPYDIGVHAAIADLKFVNRGVAPMLLPRIVSSIFELEPRCRRIMFDPDYRNTGARRVCEFAGCAFLGEHDMSNRRMALYALPRTPDDVPDVV